MLLYLIFQTGVAIFFHQPFFGFEVLLSGMAHFHERIGDRFRMRVYRSLCWNQTVQQLDQLSMLLIQLLYANAEFFSPNCFQSLLFILLLCRKIGIYNKITFQFLAIIACILCRMAGKKMLERWGIRIWNVRELLRKSRRRTTMEWPEASIVKHFEGLQDPRTGNAKQHIFGLFLPTPLCLQKQPLFRQKQPPF
jgi:hypothetical protein